MKPALYAKSLWLTRKVPIPVVVRGTTYMYESSIGISVENNQGDLSINVYNDADRALNIMIEEEIKRFANAVNLCQIMGVDPASAVPGIVEVPGSEDEEPEPLAEDLPPIELEHTEKSMDELISLGIVSKGVPANLKSRKKEHDHHD